MKSIRPIILLTAVFQMYPTAYAEPAPASESAEKPVAGEAKPEDQKVATLKAELTRIRAALQEENEMSRHNMGRSYLYPRKIAEQLNGLKNEGLPENLAMAIDAFKEAAARECAHIKEMPADDEGAMTWMTDQQEDAKFLETQAELSDAVTDAELALAKAGKVHGLGNECFILRQDDELPGVSAETFGQLELSLPAADVVKLLGEPASKDEDALMEATGLMSQTWNYPALGLTLDMESTSKGGKQSIGSLLAVAPCNMATARGVKIGSTEAEVKNAYAKEQEKESSADGESFTAGSIYGGIMFQIREGKVSQIFIGAGAE